MRNGKFQAMLLSSILAIGVLALPTFANAKESDSQLGRELVGQWIVPRNSAAANEVNTRILEIYSANGGYTAILYSDHLCGTVYKTVSFPWKIENGVLLGVSATGYKFRDQIVRILAGVMTIHDLNDGTTYTEVRFPACPGKT